MAVYPPYVPPPKRRNSEKTKSEQFAEAARTHHGNNKYSNEMYTLFGLLCDAENFHVADDYLQSIKLLHDSNKQAYIKILNGALDMRYDMSDDSFQRILNTVHGIRFRGFGNNNIKNKGRVMDHMGHHGSRHSTAPNPGLKINHPIFNSILISQDPVRVYQLLDGDYEGSGSRPWRRTKDYNGLSVYELRTFLSRVRSETSRDQSALIPLIHEIERRITTKSSVQK